MPTRVALRRCSRYVVDAYLQVHRNRHSSHCCSPGNPVHLPCDSALPRQNAVAKRSKEATAAVRRAMLMREVTLQT